MRRRLLIDGEGVGDERRLQIVLRYIVELASTVDMDQKERDVICSRILLLLDEAELCMRRSYLTIGLNEKEHQVYEDIMKELEANIESTKGKILQVKEDLIRAKSIRKNRLDYEGIVDKMEEFPSRKESLERIEKVKNESKMLSEKKVELRHRLEQRKQEIQSLVTSAQNLFSSLNADEALALEDLPDDILPEGPAESSSK